MLILSGGHVKIVVHIVCGLVGTDVPIIPGGEQTKRKK